MVEVQSGHLRVEVVEARLTRDTEMFGKMDPYCVISLGEQKFRTRVLDGAGKTPKWHQAFEFDVVSGSDHVSVQVFDEDVGKDDIVGNALLQVSTLCVKSGVDDWFTICYKGKQAGQIHLKSEWTPNAGSEGQA